MRRTAFKALSPSRRLVEGWMSARSRRYRAARQARIASRVDWSSIGSVLDLGGLPGFWRMSGLEHLPLRIVCLNLSGEARTERAGRLELSLVRGDATDPPMDPAEFDLVVSNSVIEHVGDAAATRRFAEVVRQNPRHVIQTPNRHFLVEPHYLLPFHFALPRPVKAAALMVWDRGPRLQSRARALRRADGIRLLARRDLERLFPDGDIVAERALLHVKSYLVFGPGLPPRRPA